MVSAAAKRVRSCFSPVLHPWGIMASSQSKLSGGSKASARSVSTSRLVAAKSSKPQKVAAVKSRTSPSAAPSPISKATRWQPKGRGTGAPPKGEARSASEPPAAQDPGTRGGVSKGELKAQFAKLSAATSQISGLKRTLNKTFFDVGVLLNQIRNERLYEVKGYGSFESFVEREIGLNKTLCLKTVRIAEAIQRDQAIAAGLERASAAVAALDGEAEAATPFRPASSLGGIPVHKL
jgi:hypothetical protein